MDPQITHTSATEAVSQTQQSPNTEPTSPPVSKDDAVSSPPPPYESPPASAPAEEPLLQSPPSAPTESDPGHGMQPSPPPYSDEGYGMAQPPPSGYPPASDPQYGIPPPPGGPYGIPPPPGGPGFGMPPPPPRVYGGFEAMPHTVPTSDADVEMGGEPKTGQQLLFDDTSIRQAFIRKVFFILTVQLAVVAALVGLVVLQPGWADFVGSSEPAFWASFVVFIISYVILMACKKVRRRFPGNMIILGLFTLSLGYVVAICAARFHILELFIAFAITVVTCGAVALFALQTRYDFTGCASVMIGLSFVLFFTGIAAIVVGTTTVAGVWINVVYCGLGVAVFMVFLLIDIQLIMGGKREEISPEDYVAAAALLFIDVVYIFLYILKIIALFKKSS